MSKFYGPKRPKKEAGRLPACSIVRFVLKSGAALELQRDTVEEVVGTWADQMCKAVCGCKEDGNRAVIPVDNIEYMEEVTT